MLGQPLMVGWSLTTVRQWINPIDGTYIPSHPFFSALHTRFLVDQSYMPHVLVGWLYIPIITVLKYHIMVTVCESHLLTDQYQHYQPVWSIIDHWPRTTVIDLSTRVISHEQLKPWLLLNHGPFINILN